MNNMRRSRFLLTTAALLASVSLASAQGMREGGSGGGPVPAVGMGAGGAAGGGAGEHGCPAEVVPRAECPRVPLALSREGMTQGRAAEPRAGGGRAEGPPYVRASAPRVANRNERGGRAEERGKQQIGKDQDAARQKDQTVGQGRSDATRRVNPSKGRRKSKSPHAPRPANSAVTGPARQRRVRVQSRVRPRAPTPSNKATPCPGPERAARSRVQRPAPIPRDRPMRRHKPRVRPPRACGPRVVECATADNAAAVGAEFAQRGAGQPIRSTSGSTPAWWCRGISPWCRFRRSRC